MKTFKEHILEKLKISKSSKSSLSKLFSKDIWTLNILVLIVSTSLSNDIYADNFYILSATVTKIIEDGTFYVGNIQLSPKKLFGEHEDIEENDDVYIVYVKNYPVSVMKKDSVKLDEDLKKFVKKAKGVC